MLFFLSSGLFLGWSLGANDAANVFGSAVGTRMISFRKAATIAGIFVILGAVIQGAGGAHTLGSLGKISALAGSFTVAMSAALTVFWMTKFKVPVSTSQAIVGAIIGWNFYTGNPTNYHSLSKIVTTWVAGPILGAIFAILLYWLLKMFLNRAKIHILRLDAYIRFALIIVGAFGSYSLGANNIANVMGVFISAAPTTILDFGLFTLNGIQQLFLLGSIAIAIGIFTYSRKIMEAVGNNLVDLSAEAAIVVVLAHSMVLFIFSSQSLSDAFVSVGLPAIPLVPVSSSQAIVGAILGIGLLKGGRTIQFGVLGEIALGWLTTPIISGVLAFLALFFVPFTLLPLALAKVIFNALSLFLLMTSIKRLANHLQLDSVEVSENQLVSRKITTTSNLFLTLVLLAFAIAVLTIYNRQRSIIRKNKELLKKNQEINQAQKALMQADLENIKTKKEQLQAELVFKTAELTNFALNIVQKNELLLKVKSSIDEIQACDDMNEGKQKLSRLYSIVNKLLSIDNERLQFHAQVEKTNQEFFIRLQKQFPDLTAGEKRLVTLLRLNLSSKEIATLQNISLKSVEMNRYRLRKKMNIQSENMSNFIRKL